MKVRWAIGAFAALLARAPLAPQEDCCLDLTEDEIDCAESETCS